MTLDVAALRVLASDRCMCAMSARPCWRAACERCGEILTKHDWTEDEATRYGATLLAAHRCVRATP